MSNSRYVCKNTFLFPTVPTTTNRKLSYEVILPVDRETTPVAESIVVKFNRDGDDPFILSYNE